MNKNTIASITTSLGAVLMLLLTLPSVYGDVPTFSKDIAPILQRSCQQCHNPDGIAPMPLLTYEQVKPFAALMKDRVVNRVMPPWHMDPNIGIQNFKNDISLSEQEIQTISLWSDAGAPEGDRADLPPAIKLPRGADWLLGSQLGEPDLIIRSTPFDVLANGQDQWWGPKVKFEGPDKERWLRAAEFKAAYPLGKKVVHHGHAVLEREGQRSIALARYGVGKSWEIFPENVGMKVPTDGTIAWNLHYFPIGQAVENDVVEVGLWFYPEDEKPLLATNGEVMFRVDGLNGMPRGQDILIPPHGYQVLQGVHVLKDPAVLHSFRPHMHMRGRKMTMEAIYPDGRKEVLSQVDKYNHTWQLAYIYAEEDRPLLPRGTMLLFTSVFDNTANNPINPDPNQWVVFGRRGVDEMSHAWVGITYLNDDQFGKLVADRRMLAQP